MKGTAKCYPALREHIETIPLVDCHDHTLECRPRYEDPVYVIVNSYFRSDLLSASSDEDVMLLEDSSLPLEQRWPVLERAWRRTCHTGYAQVIRRIMQRFYGQDRLTLEALRRMQAKLPDLREESAFDRILGEANIAVRLLNISPDVRKVLNGSLKLSPRGRLVIRLPQYHRICSYGDVETNVSPLGRRVTSLGEYVEACREIFHGYRRFGAVAFKDQSAYVRTLEYGNPTRAQAEEVFNWFMEDPRRSAGYPDGIKPLDDYLFHEFLRMARDLDLPVQIHTGHMAGIRNDIVKTNAAGLTRLIELHREVKFDLFHANWPYSGEVLYLCKNYPNVAIDFCWTNIIDPIYCQNMFKQAISAVPHGKIHGYGSDFSGNADLAWGHASIARDNIAIDLSDLVEMEWLGLDDAKQVAYDWLFGNANEFFRLGLQVPAPTQSTGDPPRSAPPGRSSV